MDMYVLQVKSNYEDDVFKILRKQGYNVYSPKQIKYIRRYGEWFVETEKIFNGYIFLECKLTDKNYLKLKGTPYVISILKVAGSNKSAKLKEKDVKFIKWLANDGVPLEPLEVEFNDGNAIIKDTLFNGYNFEIAEYSKRQKKIKVKMDFLGEDKIITFSIREEIHSNT